MTKTTDFLDSFSSVTIGLVQMLKSPSVLVSVGVSALFLNYYGTYEMFIEALLICIFADSVFGIWLAYKQRAFEWHKAIKIVEKIVVYAFYLLIVHFVSRIEWVHQFDEAVKYFTNFIYTLMIVNEGRSAVKNGNVVYPNRIASVIVKWFDVIEGKAKKVIDQQP